MDDPNGTTPNPSLSATAYLTESGVETPVGSTNAPATIPSASCNYGSSSGPCIFPEGALSYSNSSTFDELVITSNIGDFTIGRDTDGTGNGLGSSSSAPEPLSWALTAGGLGLLAAVKRFAKRQSA